MVITSLPFISTAGRQCRLIMSREGSGSRGCRLDHHQVMLMELHIYIDSEVRIWRKSNMVLREDGTILNRGSPRKYHYWYAKTRQFHLSMKKWILQELVIPIGKRQPVVLTIHLTSVSRDLDGNLRRIQFSLVSFSENKLNYTTNLLLVFHGATSLK